ncbi:hypothetical protein [Lysinibacillus capsici]|uniref:hypothetical protein n=1 Tax=Lysinibacillus capsici TaxID=2115968 RepID=UPI0028AF08B6|nr:hypothetical protein [Lysinibacillus capsici]
MNNSILLSTYKNITSDDTFWKPLISSQEKQEFKTLLDNVEVSLKHGTRSVKGAALEDLMTFIYSRFVGVEVQSNVHLRDNQIDHEVIFPDFGAPNFVVNHIGLKIIGESKNKQESVSSREVDNLDGLLKIRNSKLGVFSSYHSFSKGRNSVWEKGEGKRRKLALLSNFERIIIGFNVKDFNKILDGNNFYTLLKEKYHMLIDEINDDDVEDNHDSYHVNLLSTIEHLYSIGIIPIEHLDTYKQKIVEKYGNTI